MVFKNILGAFLVLFVISECYGKVPRFFRGRPRDGFVGSPPRTETTPVDLPGDQWVTQKLDHFNGADNRTWQQRYFVSDKFYRKWNGAVFLMIGGEGPNNPIWMEEGAWVEYAKTFNAMLFSIEHRFYGKSHPTPDMSVENLQYLSSEQALADNAAFIQYAKQKYDIDGVKWITFGGSYSGSLSAWQRAKYPHLVDGAVATSGPLLAVLDFKEYLGVTTASLDTTGPVCTEAIQDATAAVEKLIQTDSGRSQLKTVFRLCEDLDVSKKWDIANFYSIIAGNFEGVVQYNKDNRAFEGGVGANITINTLCGIMSNQSRGSPLQRYADVNTLMLDTYKEKCVDFSYSDMIDSLKQISWNGTDAPGGRQWTYQTCTEFGFFQSTDLANQPFGDGFPVSFFVQQCIDIFGAKFNADLINAGINRTNTNYGAKNIKATKIVFPNGSIDQWHALGLTENKPEGTYIVFIKGTAHCANMYPSSPSDSQALYDARVRISKAIGEYIQNP